MKRQIANIMALTLTLVMTVCSVVQSPLAEAKAGGVKKVSVTNVSGNKLTLSMGERFTLKTKVTVIGKVNKKLKYKSSNKSVVFVSNKGVLKAKKAGAAKVTVSAKANAKKKTVIRVVVTDTIMVNKISLNRKEITLDAGSDDESDSEFELMAVISPSNATNKTIEWSSSDTDVVEVDEDGYLVAIEPGTATVQAKAVDGSGVYAVCMVTVIDGDSDFDDDDGYDDDDDYVDDDHDAADDDYDDEDDYYDDDED